jgi:hypothetical protein
MDAGIRKQFNGVFSSELYDDYCSLLENLVGEPIGFRLAETPLFLEDALCGRLETASKEIAALLADDELTARLENVVPHAWRTPRRDRLPNFLTVDFAITRDAEGELVPRLIELQAFPSLSAFEVLQRDAWNEVLNSRGIEGDWSCWFSGLDRDGFVDLLRRTLLGRYDPEEVVLIDVDPEMQKTRCDFTATRMLTGIETVAIDQLVRKDRSLFRRGSRGKLRRVRRIHNRAIPDELMKKRTQLPFDFTDDLEVEWTPHPTWYWIWSKYAVLFLDHPTIPRSIDLSQFRKLPEDLSERWVLKPLFSFAGGGVKIDVTAADIYAIPPRERSMWCLQEKVEYAPAFIAPDGGGVKAEVRMMFLRPDEESELILAENLVRLSRGKMLGVDFNRDFAWVGSSIGLRRAPSARRLPGGGAEASSPSPGGFPGEPAFL